MRFLSVAERELRAASRRKTTHIIRSVTGAAFFVLLVWLMWVFDGFRNQRMAPQIFNVFAVLSFIYCLIVGTARTADCLSSERREGTLGLLFLTNLNSVEIVAGKLCSSALPTVYGLLAIFPIMAMPLLMGGITPEHFGRTLLALLDAILFSLAAGLLASVFCKRQVAAVGLAVTVALVFGAGLFGAATIIAEYRGPRFWVNGLSTICPLYTLVSAEGPRRIYGKNHFWFSSAAVAAVSLTWLSLVTWLLARSWRDRPKAFRVAGWFDFSNPLGRRLRAARAALRHRLLDINPFYWLAGRQPVSSPVFMIVVLAMVLITVYGTAPFFARVVGGSNTSRLVVGSLFAWLWTALAIHLLVLYYAAMISSQRLAEDKEAGALELILSTPATERTISRGLWLAFARRMSFPATIAWLVHAYFLWQCMVMCTLEPPGQFRVSATPGQFFWAAVFDEPLAGNLLDWEFCLLIRTALSILALTIVLWMTLGWLGRWLGLRMKHSGFAPLVALAVITIPPTLLFSLLCFLGGKARLFNTNARDWLPLMVWLAFGMVTVHCLLICAWAAGKLRHDFRAVVVGRFDTAPRGWRIHVRKLMWLSLRATAVVTMLALLGLGFYGCQNYRIRRNWSEFQAHLKQKGESLSVAELLPRPVPDEQNFARASEFQDVVTGKSKLIRQSLDRMQTLDLWQPYNNQTSDTWAWTGQRHAPLDLFAKWVDAKAAPDGATNNAALAPAILTALQPLAQTLDALAKAARRPAFQINTNRDPLAVIQFNRPELLFIERLHFLFTLRSLAALETDQASNASQDLLTTLRITELARQSTDSRTSQRAQVMLARSFQPLWEGLDRQQWSDSQLAAFQAELAKFNLLADHTNAVRRTVRAYIEVWKAIPETKNSPITTPLSGGGFASDQGWRMQPQTWWFNHCIALYQLGESLIAQTDVPGEYCQFNVSWGTLSSLPLEQDTQYWLAQQEWYAASPTQVAVAQTWLNQARIAIALERWRLAGSQFPKNLNQLVPGQLSRIPNDVASGRPMTYRLLPPNRYQLRGLGFNRHDDRTNTVSDDWLWAYPTNTITTGESP